MSPSHYTHEEKEEQEPTDIEAFMDYLW